MADASEKDRFLRSQDLLAAARALPSEQRVSFLERECAGDSALLEEVSSLLLASAPMAGFLEQNAPGVGLRAKLETHAGGTTARPRRIGQYLIGDLLGEGGMGSVYEAEQAEPRRRVAIKLLKSGMASADACRRFERETQFLGRLNHPAIAQVFEGGVHRDDNGGVTPWFAMEFVDGRSITTYAQEEDLSTRARVELLLQACDAVAHAHAQGILHRDLKPDNILVDGSGRLRVLDFGVARTLGEDEAQTAMLTRVGDIVGTLSYMSPEQSAGTPDAIDERSDVYALGVLSFELLTGRLPHELAGLPLPEALGRIRDIEPDRVSSLVPSLRGDLDVIVGAALEKERDRRYRSVTDFATDLRHYLLHEPIIARASSVAYRITRFARRNRAVVVGVSGIILTLAGAVVITTRFAFSEAAQRERADQQVFELSRLAQSEAKARRNTEEAIHGLRASEVQRTRQLYRVQLSGAQSALREGDIPAARALLEAAPAALRGWEWRQLEASLDESLCQLEVPPGFKVNIRFRTDGKSVVVANSEGVIRSSVPQGKKLASWTVPRGTLVRDLSPDGERILMYAGSQVWMRWLDTGKEVLIENRAHGTVEFSRSGRTIILDFLDDEAGSSLLIADGKTGLPLMRFPLAEGARWGWVSNDETMVTHSASGDPIVARHRDLTSGRIVHAFAAPPTGLVLVNPAGTIAVGTPIGTGRTCAWSLQSGERLAWEDVGSKLSVIHHGRFLPGGNRILLVHDDGLTRMVSGTTGKPVAPLAQVDTAGQAHEPAISPAGDLIAVAAAHHGIIFADPLSGRPLSRLHGQGEPLFRMRFSPDGTFLASLDSIGQARLWAVPQGIDEALLDEYGNALPWRMPERADSNTLNGHAGYIYDVAVEASGRRLATTAWDGTLRLWDLASGEAIAALESPDPTPIYGHVAWNPAGTRLISVHGETVSLWDSRDGTRIASHVLGGLALPVSSHSEPEGVAWHPTLPLVIVGTVARHVHAFTVDEDTRELQAQVWPMHGQALAFSPAGHVMALAVGTGIDLWSVQDLSHLAILEGSTRRVRRVAFSPDGKLLASTNDDGKLRFWSVPDGAPVRAFQAHVGQAHGLAWSPDGTRIATGGSDHVINIWDINGGAALRSLRGHQLYVYALAWTPDGQLLVSGSGDGDVKLWDTAPPRVRLLARRERQRLRTELRPRVVTLLAEGGGASALTRQVETLSDLDDTAHLVALDLLLELSSQLPRKTAAEAH